MSGMILSGTALAAKIRQDLAIRVQQLIQQGKRPPGLAVILVGNDPASRLYVGKKYQACQEVGMLSQSHHLNSDITQDELVKLINKLNDDPEIDGILVQFPLPPHLDSQAIVEHIHPTKDVDGFHPYNIGRLAQKCPILRPCTPRGIITLLCSIGQELKGLNATVVGTSNVVGRPMILELLMAGCTVTACHRQTRDLAATIATADLLIAAAGQPGLIKGSWIKPGAIVVDVGINRMDNGQIVGDVEFEAARKNASWITPVPGGVGPMTVATLLTNTLYAYEELHLRRQYIASRNS